MSLGEYDGGSYLGNTSADQRLLGLGGIAPGREFDSSPRANMYDGHRQQTLYVHGGEMPRCVSGKEYDLGQYCFNRSTREQDGQILAVIPRYPKRAAGASIPHNPSFYIIYLGDQDRQIHYSIQDSYFCGSEGAGFKYIWENQHLLQNLGQLDKDKSLARSPVKKGAQYNLGVNLRTAYMTINEVAEDAMVISDDAAELMGYDAVHRASFQIRKELIPLNLYGDDVSYSPFPDIGGFVRDDGVFFAARKPSTATYAADTMFNELCTVQHMHDYCTHIPPGSEILDLEFKVSYPEQLNKVLYAQVEKYQEGLKYHYEEIVRVYHEYHQYHTCSYEFLNLVANAMSRLLAMGVRIKNIPMRPKLILMSKRERPIDYIQVDFVYSYRQKCGNGSKITDTNGGKGVIMRVIPKEHMPVDEDGFRAQLIIAPDSTMARMNMWQLYEQAITRVSEFVRRQVEATAGPNAANYEPAFDMLIDYYNDINPNYAIKMARLKCTPQLRQAHVQYACKKGIFLHTPPFLKTINEQLILKLYDKWNVQDSRVTYSKLDLEGKFVSQVTTEKPVCIGEKYTFHLHKIPDPTAAGFAHVNQNNTPVKLKPQHRLTHPINSSPIRIFGEDENRVINMDLGDPEEQMRMINMLSGSPVGVDKLVETLLLSEHPTQIERVPIDNRTLSATNTNTLVFRHMMETMMIDIDNIHTTEGPPDIPEPAKVKKKKKPGRAASMLRALELENKEDEQ